MLSCNIHVIQYCILKMLYSSRISHVHLSKFLLLHILRNPAHFIFNTAQGNNHVANIKPHAVTIMRRNQ